MPRPKAAPKTGRPTKFTEGRITTILGQLRGGVTRTAAAAVAGITRQTLHEWEVADPPMLLGWDIVLPEHIDGEGEETYEKGLPFPDALARAEESAEAFLISRIKKAGTESAKVTYIYDRNGNILREVHEYDWRAAAWLAERNPKLRAKWSQKQALEISGPDGAPIANQSTVVFEPTPEYLAALGRIVKDREARYADPDEGEGTD